MRITQLSLGLAAGACLAGSAALFATLGPAPDLDLINRLDALVQNRFQNALPLNLGMSRIARPPSFGGPFHPDMDAYRDFYPERPAEQQVIAALEQRHVQVGFYLIGAAITDSAPTDLNYRALKGPAAMTHGTPRPSWYPGTGQVQRARGDTLPDWNAIYPVAHDAMRRLQNGRQGFDTAFGRWNIAVRPVIASEERCVTCHNSPMYAPAHVTKLDDVIGGVLYAYRTAEAGSLKPEAGRQ